MSSCYARMKPGNQELQLKQVHFSDALACYDVCSPASHLRLSVSQLCFSCFKNTYRPQGKLQKHQAFEAEVQANAGAIVKLDGAGNQMIAEGHFASEMIRVSL